MPDSGERDIDLSDKYFHYFSRLNYDGHMFDSKSNSATADYLRKHVILRPRMEGGEVGKEPEKAGRRPESATEGAQKPLDSPTAKFDSFVNLPSVFSDAPLTGIAYHAAATLNSSVYIFGGLVCMVRQEYEAYLRELTDDFRIPPQNIRMVFDYDVPLPLSRDKLMNLASVPNRYLFVYMPDSNAAKHVAPPDGPKMKPVLCSGVATIGTSTVLIYGGIELRTAVTRLDADHVIVKRTLHPNNDLWKFDAVTNTFREMRILVHPTYSASLPAAIGRFGHACTCLPAAEGQHSRYRFASRGFCMEEPGAGVGAVGAVGSQRRHSVESLQGASQSGSAVVLIMGGYKASQTGNSYVALNDLWRCEVFWDKSGFKDEVVCSPVGDFDIIGDQYSVDLGEDGVLRSPLSFTKSFSGLYRCYQRRWPKPRGFFSMQLVERSGVFCGGGGGCDEDDKANDTDNGHRKVNDTDEANDNPNSSPTDPSIALFNKILLINGGSTELHVKVHTEAGHCTFQKKAILGDTWWFDFRDGKWNRMATRKGRVRAELPICGHSCSTNQYHMLVMGGISRRQFDATAFDIHPETAVPVGREHEYKRAAKLVEAFLQPEIARQRKWDYTSTPQGTIGIHAAPSASPGVPAQVCYRTYVLDLQRLKWKPTNFCFLRCLRSFVDKDAFLMFACSPLVKYESKLLMLGGDVRKVCRKSYRQRSGDLQNVYGGNVTELYTSFLRM